MKVRVGLALTALFAGDASAQSLSTNATYELAIRVRNDAADLAYRRCVAGQETTREASVDFRAKILSLVRTLTGGLAFSDRQRVTRGAIDAPASVRVELDSRIRACLLQLTPVIENQLLVIAREKIASGTGLGGYPPAIEVRFTYRRTASLDPARYHDNLRVSLTEGGRARPSVNVANQSESDGSPFFFYPYVPFPLQRVQGTISAKPLNSRLTADQVPRARICFERVPAPPPPPHGPDIFACTEGGTCRPAGATRGWLRTCPGTAQLNLGTSGRQFASLSLAGMQSLEFNDAAQRRWVTPSVDTLVERPSEEVGWSYFKLRTDAFRQPEIGTVEVALAVNGVPVDEDGLSPGERPEPNDPSLPFDLMFALQTLNFEGRHGGCDIVSVNLTPLFTDGRRGKPLAVDLSYVALRDQPERIEKSAGAELAWSARVIRPIREWRHWAFIGSYAFRYANAGSQRAAVDRVEADKIWLDRQNWSYRGATIRGVIRPPLTVRDGAASYGLSVGLVQPSGQVRFTFSEAKARAIGRWMITQRSSSVQAGKIIQSTPYLFQAPSGGVTPAGICGPHFVRPANLSAASRAAV